MKRFFCMAFRMVIIGALMMPMAACEELFENENENGSENENEVVGDTIEVVDMEECIDAYHVHAIDLGLSVKWACCNVGAKSPEEYGEYYAWGETVAKDEYTIENYKYGKDLNGNGELDEDEVNIGPNISGTSYDAAHVKWGDGWRMPTQDEIWELFTKCSWEDAELNGVRGRKLVGPNGACIFLPATRFRIEDGYSRNGLGSYWSGTLGLVYEDIHLPTGLYFELEGLGGHSSFDFHLGLTIRPVKE